MASASEGEGAPSDGPAEVPFRLVQISSTLHESRPSSSIESMIASLEAFNEASAETGGAAAEELRIDAELRKLDTKSELDDELAALKAKLAAGDPKAIEEGSS